MNGKSHFLPQYGDADSANPLNGPAIGPVVSAGSGLGSGGFGKSAGFTSQNGGAALPSVWNYTMIFAATGVPQNFPNMVVPVGCTVSLRAYNGTVNGNAAAVQAALHRKDFSVGAAIALAPLDQVPFPVSNTGKVWGQGTAGDGLVITVSYAT